MTPRQKQLVKETWQSLQENIGPAAGGLFAEKIYELDPDLKKFFDGEQSTRLLAIVNNMIVNIDTFETISEDIRALGKKHVRYNVQRHQYDTVGKALLWTLETG